MKKFTVPARLEQLESVQDFISQELEQCGCDMHVQMQIEMAVEEIFVNIAHYAYPENTGKLLLGIDYDDCEKTFTFRFRDQGIPFNPLDKPDPDVTLPAEERKVGGLGIFLMKKNMDGYSYTHENNENILTMWKKI